MQFSHHGYKAEQEQQHAREDQHVSRVAVCEASSISWPIRLTVTAALLDHSVLLLYGSGMGDGNVHSRDPISSMVVGGANGQYRR